MPISANDIHPELRFTRLGAVLRHLINNGNPRDTAVGLARAIVQSPHDRELDHLPVHALSDYMLENPDHELAGKFNWESLPKNLALDKDMARFIGHGGVVDGHSVRQLSIKHPWASHVDMMGSENRVSSKNRRLRMFEGAEPSESDELHDAIEENSRDNDIEKNSPDMYSAVPVERIRLARERHQLAKYATEKQYGVWSDEFGDDRYSRPLIQSDKVFDKVVREKMGKTLPGSPWPFPPVVVSRTAGTYDLKDGHHRVEVARQLGMKVIPAVLTDVKAFGHTKPVNTYVEISHDGNHKIVQPDNENLPQIEVAVPEKKPKSKRYNRSHLVKYAAIPESEVHEDYRPTGIAPRLGHLLNKLASGEVEANGDQRGLATAILKSGDHSMLPVLADALDDTGHEHANVFDLRHAPRAIAIDKALQGVLDGTRVRSVDPNAWRWRLRTMSAPHMLADWRDGGRARVTRSSALRGIQQEVPDATKTDLHHSIIRLADNHTGGEHYSMAEGLGLLDNPVSPHPWQKEPSEWSRETDNRNLKLLKEQPANVHSYPDTRREKMRRVVKSLRKYASKFSFDWSAINEHHREHAKKLLAQAIQGDEKAYDKLKALATPKSPEEQLSDLKSELAGKLQSANDEYAKLPHEFRNTTNAKLGYTDAKRTDKRDEIINRLGIPAIQKKIDDLKAKHGIDDARPIQEPQRIPSANELPNPVNDNPTEDFELGEIPMVDDDSVITPPSAQSLRTPPAAPTREIASSTKPPKPKLPDPLPPKPGKPYTKKLGPHHPDVGLFGTLKDNLFSSLNRAADALSDPTKPSLLTKDNLKKALSSLKARSAQSVAAGRKSVGDTIRRGAGTLLEGVGQVGKDVADVFGPPTKRVAAGLKDLGGFGGGDNLTPEERDAGFGGGGDNPEPPVKVADAVTEESPRPPTAKLLPEPVVEHFHATYADPETGRTTRRIIMTTKGMDHARKWLASQRITPKELRYAEPHELTTGLEKGTRREKFARPGELNEEGARHEPDVEPDMGEYIANQFSHFGAPQRDLTPEVGYILKSGHGVPMGRHGQRYEDHRAALPSRDAMRRWGWPEDVVKKNEEGMRYDSLQELLRRSGAIRFNTTGHNGDVHINIATEPTEEQIRAISNHVRQNSPENVILEHPENGDVELANPKPHKVVAAIRGLSSKSPEKFAAMRAPAGGMIVRGNFYPGGRVIPDLEKFSPKARARLDRLRARWKEKAKMECGQPHKMAREGEPHDETYSHAANVINEKVGPTADPEHIFDILY